ncbi:MAG: PAS domain-containing protein [Verrucomicrobia bacterium]|nr:PAS domain-containing protein [Verrucomicrobiota bacterium]
MELFADLKNRLSFRAGGGKAGDRGEGIWERLVGSGSFLVATIDRSGKIQSANGVLCRARETEEEGVVGTSLLYLVNAEDRTAFSDLVREVFAGASGGSGQARLLAAGGQTPQVHWVLLPEPSGEGAVERVVCLGVDLSGYFEGGVNGERTAELGALKEALAGLERENAALRNELEEKVAEGAVADRVVGEGRTELSGGLIPGLEEGERSPTLGEVERRYILHVLEETKGRISGAKGAAAILGLHPNTLRSRMAKLGVGRG